MLLLPHYRELLDASATALSDLGANAALASEFSKAHNRSYDYELLKLAVGDRPESRLLESAISEYSFALLAAASGNYRHAFISLRLFFELALGCVYFSAHEVKCRKWLANSEDIVFTKLMDSDEGVFSKSFVKAFSPGIELHSGQFSAIASAAYRECSEYVHGNNHTHLDASKHGKYEEKLLEAWLLKADAVDICVHFCFAARYLGVCHTVVRNQLEGLFLGKFGHLPEVRAFYE